MDIEVPNVAPKNNQYQDELKVISGGEYYETIGLRELAHGVKKGDHNCIAVAAKLLASKIPDGSTLVPVPSSCGFATYTLSLAKQIAKEKDGHVVVENILKGSQRETLYSAKKRGSVLSSEEFGFIAAHPVGKGAILIDNVLATGLTYAEVKKVVPDSQMAVIAVDSSANNNLLGLNVVNKVDSDLAHSIVQVFEEEWLSLRIGLTPRTLRDALDSKGFYGAAAAENLPTTDRELSEIFDETLKGVMSSKAEVLRLSSHGITDKEVIEGWVNEQRGNYEFVSRLSACVEEQYDSVFSGNLKDLFLSRAQDFLLNQAPSLHECILVGNEQSNSVEQLVAPKSLITSEFKTEHKPNRPRV